MPRLHAYVLQKVFVIAFCSMLSGVVVAQNSREVIACASHTPPFVLVENERGVAGFSVDLLRMLATEMKRDLKVLELPWARCLNEVKAADLAGARIALCAMLPGMCVRPRRVVCERS